MTCCKISLLGLEAEVFNSIAEGWQTSNHRKATKFAVTSPRAVLMCTKIEEYGLMFCRPVTLY
jgi:hypothetical protein